MSYGSHTFTVAAFVQANFGSRAELTVASRHVGPSLAGDNPIAGDWFAADLGLGARRRRVGDRRHRDRRAAAARSVQSARAAGADAAGRAGTTGSHFSGDIFLAFSTAPAPALRSAFPTGPIGDDDFGTLTCVPWGRIDPFFGAVVESVEEAVLNALIVNDDMVGRDGHRSPRLHTSAWPPGSTSVMDVEMG